MAKSSAFFCLSRATRDSSGSGADRTKEGLIEAARERARQEHTTLNAEFRRWLAQYAKRQERAEDYRKVMDELRGKVRVGKKLSREGMNER